MSAVPRRAAATVHVVTPEAAMLSDSRLAHSCSEDAGGRRCGAVPWWPPAPVPTTRPRLRCRRAPTPAPAAQHGPDVPGVRRHHRPDHLAADRGHRAGRTRRAPRWAASGWPAAASSARTSPSPSSAAARSGASARPRNCPAPAWRTSPSRATNGFIAIGEDLVLGPSLCEIGIQFDDDFIEWSVSFAQKPFPGRLRSRQGTHPPVDCERQMIRRTAKRPLTVVIALLAALTMVLGVQGCSRAVDGHGGQGRFRQRRPAQQRLREDLPEPAQGMRRADRGHPGQDGRGRPARTSRARSSARCAGGRPPTRPGLIDITRFWFEQGDLDNETPGRRATEVSRSRIGRVAGVQSIVMRTQPRATARAGWPATPAVWSAGG